MTQPWWWVPFQNSSSEFWSIPSCHLKPMKQNPFCLSLFGVVGTETDMGASSILLLCIWHTVTVAWHLPTYLLALSFGIIIQLPSLNLRHLINLVSGWEREGKEKKKSSGKREDLVYLTVMVGPAWRMRAMLRDSSTTTGHLHSLFQKEKKMVPAWSANPVYDRSTNRSVRNDYVNEMEIQIIDKN